MDWLTKPVGGRFLYQRSYDLEHRTLESTKIRRKYPQRVPIICETTDRTIRLDKFKYLVPDDLTVGHFVATIRRMINISAEQAIFIFIDGANGELLPPTSATIGKLYKDHQNIDGFMYVRITTETTFG